MLFYSFIVNPRGHDLSAYMSWLKKDEKAHSDNLPLSIIVGKYRVFL
jgi:hypothetical protein